MDEMNNQTEQPTQYTDQYTAMNNEMKPNQDGKGMAIASLVLGILSLVCCCIPVLNLLMAIIGLILGIVAMKKGNESIKGLAIAGMVTSGLGILSGLYMIIVVGIQFATMDWGSVDWNDPDSITRMFNDWSESMQ